MRKRISQCANCESFFVAEKERFMFCSKSCECEHDLFKWAEKKLGTQPSQTRTKHHYYTTRGVLGIAHS